MLNSPVIIHYMDTITKQLKILQWIWIYYESHTIECQQQELINVKFKELMPH